ncbi:MAG: hypothetical protein KIT87_14060 [Anaerolineae bacterium]|nr:hypothetical protein [Anaerolineae bacterium]
MRRLALFALSLLVVALALRAGDAQGAMPSDSYDSQQGGCAEIQKADNGFARRLKGCGQVDPKADPETVARAVLKAQAARLGLQADGKDLRLTAVQPTDVATHVRFEQTYKGVPIFLGQVLVQYNRQGAVDLIVNQTLPNLSLDVTPKLSAEDAAKAAEAAVSGSQDPGLPSKRDLVIYGDGVKPTLAWHIMINTVRPAHEWHLVVSAEDAKVLTRWDAITSPKKTETDKKTLARAAVPLDKLAEGSTLRALRRPGIGLIVPMTTATPTATPAPGSAGSALVYNPNPIQENGDRTLRDNNDANSTALANTRVQLPVRHLAMTTAPFTLKGTYVDVTSAAPSDCNLPYRPGLAREDTPVFNYTRDDDRFEEAEVYTAIDSVQTWFQALGITAANNRQQPANVHCFADDNSYYRPSTGILHYGDGGVDDAEDAEIVIHEYGHAVQDNQVPGFGPGDTEQGAMGESWGDILAGMYYHFDGNAAYQANYGYCIGDWDATGYNAPDPNNPGSGCLRWINGRDEGTGNDVGRYSGTPTQRHDDSRYYSAAQTCIFEGMGANLTARDNLIKIILQSQFSLVATTSNQAFEDAVDALLLADRNLLGGAHQRLITECMVARGIIALPNAVAPTLTFPRGGEVVPPASSVNITWTTNGAPADTTYVAEYNAQCRPVGDFYDDVESGTGGWTVSHASGTQDWRIVSTDSHSPTHSWFGPSSDSVTELSLVSQPISVGAGSVLSFWHRYNLEGSASGDTGYDGGVVEVSADATTWTDLGPQMTQNGYNRTISSTFGNPLAGRRAFSYDSGGWVETRATLTGYVGQSVQFRFRLATDRSVTQPGWWVDDILVGTPTDTTWQSIGRSAPGATSLTWTTPSQQGLNYCVRVRAEAEGFAPSAWSQGQPFAVYQGTPPTMTPTRTPQVPPTITPTPTNTPVTPVTPTRTPTPTPIGPVVTPTITATPPAPSCYYLSVLRLYEVLPTGMAQRIGNVNNAFSVNAIGRQRSFPDILLYRYLNAPLPGSGESTFAALNLFTTTPPLNDAVAYVTLNVPSGWSYVGATCTDVSGRSCRQPASGTSSRSTEVILDFSCNAVLEYRYYVQRATSSYMVPPGVSLLSLPEMAPATGAGTESLPPFSQSR